MPRTGQIIPEYLVPHVQTYINDNSTYTDISEVESEDGIRFINVFTSSKGEDGVLKMIKSAAGYIEEYGTPNYQLYGQPCYMPYAALQSGQARCWCMRLMPEDAAYANTIINVKVKTFDIESVTKADGEELYLYNSGATQMPADKAQVVTNADRIYVGNYTKVGNDAEITVKANAELETISYYEGGVAYPGKWFSILVDAGIPIVGKEYITKYGDSIIFGESDIKEAVAAGGPEYEKVSLNGVDAFIVKGSLTEVTDEAGNTVQVAEEYHHFVQWVNIEEDVMVETLDEDGKTVIQLDRTITWKDTDSTAHTLKIKFIPYDEDVTVTDFPVMDVKFETEHIEGLLDKDSFGEYVNTTDAAGEVTTDENGYTVYPVIGIRSLGRGEYGNSLSVRISSDTISDRDNGYKNYIIEILDNDETLVKKEYFRACMCEYATIDNTSMFVNDVINDIESGSDKIELIVNPDNFTKIYESYISTVPETVQYPKFDEFDFLFGKFKNRVTESIPYYSVNAESIALDGVDGIGLTGGTEGSFDISNPDREKNIEAAYIEAFSGNKTRFSRYTRKGVEVEEIQTTNENGIYDRAILSKRRAPAEFILDANYPESVKKAIIAFALKRYDAQCIIDAGIETTTVSAAIAWAKKMYDFADPIITKECSMYKIKDPFNGKCIPVTSVYNAALNLPNHFATYGNHIPFVGEKYAMLNGFVKNSVKPAIDADDLYVKEQIYTNNVNFYECIGENKFIKAVQTTAQTIVSDLSEMNNMAVLLDMKRQIEDYVSRQIYNFANASERSKFTADVDRMFADYVNSKVKTFSVEFDMNEFEEVRNILHCYLEVTFRTMAKRGIIEIDINKRVNTTNSY